MANIIDPVNGDHVLVLTDSSGNVIRRLGKKVFPGGRGAKKSADRCTPAPGHCVRVVPASALPEIL